MLWPCFLLLPFPRVVPHPHVPVLQSGLLPAMLACPLNYIICCCSKLICWLTHSQRLKVKFQENKHLALTVLGGVRAVFSAKASPCR